MPPTFQNAGILSDDFLARIPCDCPKSRVHIFDGALGIGDDEDLGRLFASGHEPGATAGLYIVTLGDGHVRRITDGGELVVGESDWR